MTERPAPPAPSPPYRVGYRVVDFPGPGGAPVTVAVWYPTDTPPAAYLYGGGPNEGRVALDAPIRAGGERFPLLLFSHGYGGSGVGAAFFTEALAARGWIVAAPDHEDRDKVARIRTGPQKTDRFDYLQRALSLARAGRDFDRSRLAYRLDEFRASLDGLLASPDFAPRIDAGRVAAAGHSLGGFTAIAACGAWAPRRDGRYRACLLFSPAIFMFGEREFEAVTVPTFVLLGERERDDLRSEATKAEIGSIAFGRFPAPKYYGELRGGTHFSFNQPAASGLVARQWSGSEAEFEAIRAYGIAFLERHVAARWEAGAILDAPDRRLSAFRTEPGPAAAERL